MSIRWWACLSKPEITSWAIFFFSSCLPLCTLKARRKQPSPDLLWGPKRKHIGLGSPAAMKSTFHSPYLSPTLFRLPQWSLRGSSCWECLSCNQSVPVSAVLDAELGELVNWEVKFKHPALGSYKTYVICFFHFSFTDMVHIFAWSERPKSDNSQNFDLGMSTLP